MGALGLINTVNPHHVAQPSKIQPSTRSTRAQVNLYSAERPCTQKHKNGTKSAKHTRTRKGHPHKTVASLHICFNSQFEAEARKKTAEARKKNGRSEPAPHCAWFAI